MSDKPEINVMKNLEEKNIEAITAAEPQAALPNEDTIPPHKKYIRRMKKFQKYYIQLLMIVCAIIAVSVVIAVVYNLLLGVSIAIFAAILYNSWAVSEMYKEIGIKYKSITGGIKITACKQRYGEIMWIPASLIHFDVIEIDDRAFAEKNNENLVKIFLPKTLKYIGENVFVSCDSLKEIFFEGNEEEWNQIEKKTDLSSYKIIFDAKYPPMPRKKRLQLKKK